MSDLTPKDLQTSPQPDTDKNYFNFKATNLKLDKNYAIKFQWVYSDGVVSEWSPGKFLNTSAESVPGSPSASVPSTSIGNIPVTLSVFPENAKRVDIYIIGGVFGTGKVVDSFFAAGTKTISISDPGVYQVQLIAVTPSNINGTPSQTFTVTVSNIVTEDTTAPDPISSGIVSGGVNPQDPSGRLGYLNVSVTNSTIPTDFAGYIVKIVSSTNTWTQTFNSSTALSNLYITGGLFVGQSYTLSVATTDGKNISSYVNCSPSPLTITDTRTNTSTVTGNLSFSATDSILTVSWAASTDPYVDSYRVQVTSNADTTFASPIQTVESKGTTATFGGLESNTTYRIRVTARYGGVEGTLSTNHTTGTFTLNASGAISDGDAPTTNPALTSSMVKSLFGAFAITFPPVANADAVSYEVFIKPANATGIVDDAYKVLEVSGTFAVVRTLADRQTTLSYGTNYYIAIRARDADGVSTGVVTAVGPIQTTQVSTQDLADLGITEVKIDTNAITSAKIAAGAITEIKIDNDAITAAKIATGAITETKIAADAITAPKIAAGSIEAGKIVAGAITADKIAANAVEADKIAANAVTASKIAAGSIEAGKIAAGAVTAEKIEALAISADKIAANAITATKILAGEIKAAAIDTGAIVAGKIATDAIVANNIQSGQIDATKLTSDTILANQKITVGSNAALDRIRLDATNATIAGQAVSSRIYIGGGNYYDIASPFYADNLGRLSIGQKLKFENGELTINGKGTFTGTVTAGTGTTVVLGNDVEGTNDGIYISGTGDYIYSDGRVRLGNGGITYASGVLTVTGNITANALSANATIDSPVITGGSYKTSATVGNGSTAGIKIDTTGIYGYTASSATANFSVSNTGVLTANAGNIGNWVINSGKLASSSGASPSIELDPLTPQIVIRGSSSNITLTPVSGITAGSTFSVTPAGYLSSTSGSIAGWNVTTSSISKTSQYSGFFGGTYNKTTTFGSDAVVTVATDEPGSPYFYSDTVPSLVSQNVGQKTTIGPGTLKLETTQVQNGVALGSLLISRPPGDYDMYIYWTGDPSMNLRWVNYQGSERTARNYALTWDLVPQTFRPLVLDTEGRQGLGAINYFSTTQTTTPSTGTGQNGDFYFSTA